MSVFEDGKTVFIPLCLQHHVSLSALGNIKDARHLHLLICLCFLWTCRFLKHFDKNRNIISVCLGVLSFTSHCAGENKARRLRAILHGDVCFGSLERIIRTESRIWTEFRLSIDLYVRFNLCPLIGTKSLYSIVFDWEHS